MSRDCTRFIATCVTFVLLFQYWYCNQSVTCLSGCILKGRNQKGQKSNGWKIDVLKNQVAKNRKAKNRKAEKSKGWKSKGHKIERPKIKRPKNQENAAVWVTWHFWGRCFSLVFGKHLITSTDWPNSQGRWQMWPGLLKIYWWANLLVCTTNLCTAQLVDVMFIW